MIQREWKLIAACVLSIAVGTMASIIASQARVIRDQRVYIEAGCNGRYQGE